MDTIIIKPKITAEYKEVLSIIRRFKIRAEILKAPSKNQILENIENGAKNTSSFLKGKTKLQDAKALSEL